MIYLICGRRIFAHSFAEVSHKMFEILKYIHENIALPLSAAETAEAFGYSKWYFCKKFRNFTGKTFVEYVRNYRIQLAALDVLKGKRITDIAFECGYESIGGFNKAFLQYFGCLPRKYREHAKSCQLYYERRKSKMYQLTDRCATLREEAVNKKSYMCRYFAQRNVYFTLGIAASRGKGLSNEEIICEGICNVLDNFKPFIAPDELIVGFNYSDAELAEDFEHLRYNGFTDEEITEYFSVRDHAYDDYEISPNPKFTKAEIESDTERSGIGKCMDSNHSVIDYEKVLKLGFEWLLKEVETYEAANGELPLYRD